MALKCGTQTRYLKGCRCEQCKAAHRLYAQEYRQRKAGGVDTTARALVVVPKPRPTAALEGSVEAGVRAEIDGLANTELRPGLAQAALALARLMDDPMAMNQKPAAAAKLVELLDKLRKGADERRSRLASVRAMTSAKSITG